MTLSLAAAMAMAMAAPAAAEAEHCATNYTLVSMILAVGSTPENATQEEKDAAIAQGAPFFGRALRVLETSGVIQQGADMPQKVTDNVVAMIDKMSSDKSMIEKMVKDIQACDTAYGLEPIPLG